MTVPRRAFLAASVTIATFEDTGLGIAGSLGVEPVRKHPILKLMAMLKY